MQPGTPPAASQTKNRLNVACRMLPVSVRSRYCTRHRGSSQTAPSLHYERWHQLCTRVDQLAQPRLAIGKLLPDVVAVSRQQVERDERGRMTLHRRHDLARVGQQAASGEVVEDRPAVAQADTLAVEHCGLGADRGTGNLSVTRLPCRVNASTRSPSLCKRLRQPSHFDFKNISVIIKRLVPHTKQHGLDGCEQHR